MKVVTGFSLSKDLLTQIEKNRGREPRSSFIERLMRDKLSMPEYEPLPRPAKSEAGTINQLGKEEVIS